MGACVGVRGTRVKNIIRELNNEKIDILPYSEDKVHFLENTLDPIEIKKISLSEDESKISIVVEDEDYPAVLGKKGMNARLCGSLIGIDLDVQRMSEYQTALNIQRAQIAVMDDPSLDETLQIEGMSPFILESLISAGYDTPRKVLNASSEALTDLFESKEIADKVLEEVKQNRL